MSNYRCDNCGKTLPGATRRYCTDEACKRAAAAERQRAKRARAKGEAKARSVETPSASEPVPDVFQGMDPRTTAAVLMIGECPECFGTAGYGLDDCAHRRARKVSA